MNMKHFLYAILALSSNATLAYKIYVANYDNNTIGIAQTITGATTGTISSGTLSGPYIMAITPDGTKAYVSNSLSGTISIIDVATNTVTGTVAGSFNVPLAIAITPDGSKAYVTNNGNSTVSII